MDNYRHNREWSDGFLDDIRAIVAKVFGLAIDQVSVSGVIDDMFNCADLIITWDNWTTSAVACRVRSYEDWLLWGHQWTVRNKVRSGHRSEFEKIMAGRGDFIFYGFSNPSETGFIDWFVGDLDWFRLEIQYREECGLRFGQECCNVDGSSTFLAFNRTEIIPLFYIAEAVTTTNDN